jgi:hypothetical protein
MEMIKVLIPVVMASLFFFLPFFLGFFLRRFVVLDLRIYGFVCWIGSLNTWKLENSET